MKTVLYLSLLYIITIVYSCKKSDNNVYALSPNISYNINNRLLNDSTLVLDTVIFKNLDLDNDGRNDLEFYLEERNGDYLEYIDFKVNTKNSFKIHGDIEYYDFCIDSIFFIHYQFYIYRVYNCNYNLSYGTDTNFCTQIINDYSAIENSLISDESILFYRKNYFPNISPYIITEDITKGYLIPGDLGYMQVSKNDKKFLISIKWDRPYFIIEDIIIL